MRERECVCETESVCMRERVKEKRSSLIKNSNSLYDHHRSLGITVGSYGRVVFLMSEAPL